MATYFGNIDLSHAIIGDIEVGNNGNKYRKISYEGRQLKDIQLCKSVHDPLKCAYGKEAVAVNEPSKLCIKLETSEELSAFINTLDELVRVKVNDSTLTQRSALKKGTITDTVKIRILPETVIMVATLKDNGNITQPRQGEIEDLTPNSSIIPIIKITGGVYYIESNYGVSIAASQLLVIQGNKNLPIAFNLGVDMEQD